MEGLDDCRDDEKLPAGEAMEEVDDSSKSPAALQQVVADLGGDSTTDSTCPSKASARVSTDSRDGELGNMIAIGVLEPEDIAGSSTSCCSTIVETVDNEPILTKEAMAEEVTIRERLSSSSEPMSNPDTKDRVVQESSTSTTIKIADEQPPILSKKSMGIEQVTIKEGLSSSIGAMSNPNTRHHVVQHEPGAHAVSGRPFGAVRIDSDGTPSDHDDFLEDEDDEVDPNIGHDDQHEMPQATMIIEQDETTQRRSNIPIAEEDLEHENTRAVAASTSTPSHTYIVVTVALVHVVAVIVLLVVLVDQQDDDKAQSSPDKSFEPEDVLAQVPETICMERVPGAGFTELCTAEDTMEQGGGACQLVINGFLDQIPSAHVGIQNSGACRKDIAQGEFSYLNATIVLPHINQLYVVELSGEEIWLLLEQTLQNVAVNNSTGSYPYCAGLRFDVDLMADFGSRVSHVEVNERLAGDQWRPIRLDENLKMVANAYMVEADGDSFAVLRTAPKERKVDTGKYATDTFAQFAYHQRVLWDPPRSSYSTQSIWIPPNTTLGDIVIP